MCYRLVLLHHRLTAKASTLSHLYSAGIYRLFLILRRRSSRVYTDAAALWAFPEPFHAPTLKDRLRDDHPVLGCVHGSMSSMTRFRASGGTCFPRPQHHPCYRLNPTTGFYCMAASCILLSSAAKSARGPGFIQWDRGARPHRCLSLQCAHCCLRTSQRFVVQLLQWLEFSI